MSLPRLLMVGTGEYTTGYVRDGASGSDKSAGVVALTCFDLRDRGRLGDLSMAGANGAKFPAIRRHLQDLVGDKYSGLDVSFRSFPADDTPRDPLAYLAALDALEPGDLVTVFTPDDTHFEIAMRAVERGMHVLVAKPIVKNLREHLLLAAAARRHGVLVAMEVHKRWDPLYADARDRIRELGAFSFFSSYMSQPKSQLGTFRAWAGKSSDISFYLNAHHVDFNNWVVEHCARPLAVSAIASTGVAAAAGLDTEDTITLCVEWENLADRSRASALYTSSWIAPQSDVHSQQRFFYMGHKGELNIDQAHRGYALATDTAGYASPNPLFMKYAPDARGRFAGQHGYGYRSIEAFVEAAQAVRTGKAACDDFNGRLATVHDTTRVTAILDAGRRSLDAGGQRFELEYDAAGQVWAINTPTPAGPEGPHWTSRAPSGGKAVIGQA
ncbi:putative oxidoreductase YdgJ [Pirellulimonas nuda]|uniref:Putative oxidoreductase YdgJ n=1 Tax=Pirellulimonas nuda TaxID=2528009 RepID=A0A518DE98_9BACT|nr:Gfo/Idh/MocA family oxidoreductase [Pirellulimonas nuda]QDU89783.1 putative oxidoreductase YdgJ [Pirellulimonas nuda]